MKRNRIWTLILLAAVLCLAGCSMRTVDQMYCLPKRSEDHKDLRSAIDRAMAGLEYCAPLSGENQQMLQEVDLDGDGSPEYLVYAKGGDERPLRILVFDQVDDTFAHVTTIESNGNAFDLVEYVQMDNQKGMEIVVGSSFSDQPLRSVAVYKFKGSDTERLLATNYTKFLTVDLDGDMLAELFVLRPGATETDNGVAELYGVQNGTMERTNEVNMSCPADKLKRILFGKLNDGEPAVYAATSMDDTALITDVFAYLDSMLVNVSFSNESGTSVRTLRNYYVYADDIDNDGVVELPYLITMTPVDQRVGADRQDLIRWYAMKSDGSEVSKLYTYHNFVGGWYLELDSTWAPQLTVQQDGSQYDFFLWTSGNREYEKIFTVYALTGQNREEQAALEGRFVLLKTDSVTYCALLHDSAEDYAVTRDSLTRSFRLIESEWKTGET